jgi:hypothetical protein
LNEASSFDLTRNSSTQGEDSDVSETSTSNGDDIDMKIQNRGLKPLAFSLDGTPTAYPFDEYYINLLLAVPFINANLGGSTVFENQVNSTWDTSSNISQINNDNIVLLKNIASDCQLIPEIKNSLLCGDSRRAENGSSLGQINLNFKRNSSVAIILVPLIAIFFLLGAIFIFESNTDISNRLTLTIGVFAVIFSLPEIINSGRPFTSAPTIADSMLSIIIIATITFTASSVLSSSSVIQNRFPNHWRWIDRIVFLFVSGVVIAYFVFSDYPKTIMAWLAPLIIFALGYGLLLKITKVKISTIRKLLVIGGSVATISVLAVYASFYYNSSYADQNSLSEIILDPKLVTLKNGSGLDKFNSTMIYPTKEDGEEWYITSAADPDKRERDIRYNMETSDYANAGETNNISAIDHSGLDKRGYITSQSDWKNVEMTGYINAKNVTDDEDLILYVRGERHNERYEGCLGTSYRGHLTYDGYTRFSKEQRHYSNQGVASIEKKPNLGSIIGKWVGMKMIVYNFEQNGKVNVNMEIWVDRNNDGNWTKVDQWIDSGGWGDQGRKCGGESDQIITWGGPIATFRINGLEDTNDIEVDKLSIREIEPPAI